MAWTIASNAREKVRTTAGSQSAAPVAGSPAYSGEHSGGPVDGLPFGLSIVHGPCNDATLVGVARALTAGG
jgi:Asp-tRNA(Asn)/Glu-tRNA(Gln) amidotransferase A subunit family amidase